MTQHIDPFYGWCLGLGFVLIVICIWFTWWLIEEDKIQISNPLGPFIRAWDRRSITQQRIALIKAGADPDYIKFLEQKGGLDK